MKINQLKLISSFILAVAILSSKPTFARVSSDKSVKEIVNSMTLEQKAQLVIGTGMYFPIPDSIREKMPPGFGGGREREDTPYNRMVDKIRTYLPGTAGISSEGLLEINGQSALFSYIRVLN